MAYDAFIVFGKKTTEIKGETTDAEMGPKGAIQMYSFSWGMSNPSSVSHGSGMGAGKVSFSSFNFMKRVDTASTALATCCATGEHIPTATIHIRKSGNAGKGQQEYLTYTLTEVMVDSVQVSGSSGGDDYPTESVSIAFGAIKEEYKMQKPGGDLDAAKTFSWDQTKNTA